MLWNICIGKYVSEICIGKHASENTHRKIRIGVLIDRLALEIQIYRNQEGPLAEALVSINWGRISRSLLMIAALFRYLSFELPTSWWTAYEHMLVVVYQCDNASRTKTNSIAGCVVIFSSSAQRTCVFDWCDDCVHINSCPFPYLIAVALWGWYAVYHISHDLPICNLQSLSLIQNLACPIASVLSACQHIRPGAV